MKDFIKNRRNELRLTQKEVAAQLGISSQAYGHYENGKRSLPIEFIVPLSSILKVDIEALVVGITSLPLA